MSNDNRGVISWAELVDAADQNDTHIPTVQAEGYNGPTTLAEAGITTKDYNKYTPPTFRKFETGATRDLDTNKYDYEGFISPLVTKRFGQYMHLHRKQADGSLRGSDNWQKGIPLDAYIKSLTRHVEDVKLHHDGFPNEAADKDLESALCAVLFNAQGYLFELLKRRQ